MNWTLSLSIVVALLGASFQSQAQTSLEGIATGRYEIHKSSAKPKRRPASEDPAPVVTDADGVKVRTLKESELAAEEKARKDAELAKIEAEKKAAEKKEAEAKALEVKKAETSSPVVSEKETPKEETSAKEVEEPGIGEQAQSLFSSKAEKIYEFYREQIHPDDIRNNRLELDITPVVAYNDSQSNYSYRDYQSFFNALKIKSDIWFTPLIGVTGQVMFSLAADVDSLDANKSKVPAKYEFVDLGVNFRKFFGVSRKSNSLEFSILYSDNKFNVPSDNTSRVKIKSSGFGVGLKARLPSSASYAWVFGGNFFPRLQHSESETGINVNSGSSEESSRLAFDFGGEWKFTRESQLIWNLGVSTERNVFDGSANLPDPSTGTTPSNVSVTNSLYMFSLGYRWGH